MSRGSCAATLCKHGRREGGRFQCSQSPRREGWPTVLLEIHPQPLAQITLFTEPASPVPLSPTFSKHLPRRDTQRERDNLRTTVTPRASEQNDLTSESLGIILFLFSGRPEVTPVPSRTWTCALQTTFMPEEPAFSWLPVMRGLLFSGGSSCPLPPVLGTTSEGAARGPRQGVNALETNTGRQLLLPGRPKPEFTPPQNPWWKARTKSQTIPSSLHTGTLAHTQTQPSPFTHNK